MSYFRENRTSLTAFLLATLALACAGFDMLDSVIYTAWLRAHIHWFTPIIPIALVLLALKRKEKKLPIVVTALVIIVQYQLLQALEQIGRAGSAVWKLL